jgi:cation transport ATPase
MLTFEVRGMTCADCSERLEILLKADACLEEATVLLMAGLAKVKPVSSATLSEEELTRLCGYGTSLGFSMKLRSSSAGELLLDLQHPGPAPSLSSLPMIRGVVEAVPSALPCQATGQPQVRISYTPTEVGARHLLGTLRLGGAAASPCTHSAAAAAASSPLTSPAFRLALCLTLALASILVSYTPAPPSAAYDAPFSAQLSPRVTAAWALASITMVLYFPPLAAAAWGAAYHTQQLTMDTLVCISSGTAYLLSLGLLLAAWGGAQGVVDSWGEPPFEATSILLALVALAREIDGRAKVLTLSALSALTALQCLPAHLATPAPCAAAPPSSTPCPTCTAGEAEAVAVAVSASALPLLPPSLLHLGDVVRVAPGAAFPCDGEVVWGSSSVSQALVTGEATPLGVAPGARVIGGTLNCAGGEVLGVRVGLLPGGGTVARMLALIEDAQTHRPRIQGVANAVAAAFTPAVLVLSLATFGAWWGAAAAGGVGSDSSLPPPLFALQFALSLLVVSCPCVVALAVAPVTHAATCVAAGLGICVKGGGCPGGCRGVHCSSF